MSISTGRTLAAANTASSEDIALGLARCALGTALVHRESPAERERGLVVLGQARDMCLHGRFYQFLRPVLDAWVARERARRGDRDGARWRRSLGDHAAAAAGAAGPPHGDDGAYRDLVERYRAMATSLGFEGHMKWAEAMP